MEMGETLFTTKTASNDDSDPLGFASAKTSSPGSPSKSTENSHIPPR